MFVFCAAVPTCACGVWGCVAQIRFSGPSRRCEETQALLKVGNHWETTEEPIATCFRSRVHRCKPGSPSNETARQPQSDVGSVHLNEHDVFQQVAEGNAMCQQAMSLTSCVLCSAQACAFGFHSRQRCSSSGAFYLPGSFSIGC